MAGAAGAAGLLAAVAVYEYDYQYDGGLLLAAGGRRGAAALWI